MSGFYLAIAFVIYACIMVGLGIKAFRRVKTTDQFIIGGKSIGAIAGALSAEAADMSAWLFMGLPGAIYIAGSSSAWIAVGLCVGTILNWVFVAKRLRKKAMQTASSTLPSFFKENTFGSQKLTKLLNFCVCFVIIIFFSVYVGSGFVAGGKFFSQVFGVSYFAALIITTSIILAYTFLGGFLSIAWTSVVQGVLMIISVLFVPITAMICLGSIQNSFSVFPVHGQQSTTLAIVNSLAWGLGYFGMPHILIKYMAIKDAKSINRGAIIASIWVSISLFAAVLIGNVGRSFFGATRFSEAESENLFIHLIEKLFVISPANLPLLGGFFLCAILSAIMSTAASQLLLTASTVSVDVISEVFRRKISDKVNLAISRSCVFLITVFGFCIALNPTSSVMKLVSYSWAGFGAAFGPLILMILFLKRVEVKAAIIAVISGCSVVIFWDLHPNLSEIYSLLPAFFISLLVSLIANYFFIKKQKNAFFSFAQAKTNLIFKIEGIENNGKTQMHLVDTIYYSLSIYDKVLVKFFDAEKESQTKTGLLEIKMKTAKNGVSNSSSVPLDENNLAVKAVQKCLESAKIADKIGYKIFITKQIPVAAGLGGGSADAAAALTCTEDFLRTKGIQIETDKIAQDLGADVPFSLLTARNVKKGIEVSAARGTHFGEKLVEIKTKLNLQFQIHSFEKGISTPLAFSEFDNCNHKSEIKNEQFLEVENALKNSNAETIFDNLANDLQSVAFSLHDNCKNEYNKIKSKKSVALISGSGPTIIEYMP